MERKKKLTLAEESPKTRKAREKLLKQLMQKEKQITSQALEKKTIEIQKWISRHAHNRIILKSKNIGLFDENQNAAGLSRRVSSLADILKSEK